MAVEQPDGGLGWEGAEGQNLEPKGGNGGSDEDRRAVVEGSVEMKRRLAGGRQRRPDLCRRPRRAKRSPFAGVCPSSFGFGTKPETGKDLLYTRENVAVASKLFIKAVNIRLRQRNTESRSKLMLNRTSQRSGRAVPHPNVCLFQTY